MLVKFFSSFRVYTVEFDTKHVKNDNLQGEIHLLKAIK